MKAIASIVAVTLAAGGALAADTPARIFVSPLCAPTESWNQDAKMGTYIDGMVCGCDPLAWGQILVYHALNHGAPSATWAPPEIADIEPALGWVEVNGEKVHRTSLSREPFDWVAVRDRVWSTRADGERENPVARLMYDFGTIGGAAYTPGNTAGTVGGAQFIAYTGFPSQYRYEAPSLYWTELQALWPDLLRRVLRCSLQVGAPLGAAFNAHMTVCDGWGVDADGSDRFHVNYGWAGGSNAWFDWARCLSEWTHSPENTASAIYALTYPTALGSIVVGRVAAPDQSPIAGATVTLTHENGTAYTAATDANGLYAFTRLPLVDTATLYPPDALPTDTYTVTVSAPGYVTQSKTVSVEGFIDSDLRQVKQDAYEEATGKEWSGLYPFTFGGTFADFTLEPAVGRTVFLAAGGTGKGTSWADAAPLAQASLDAAAGRIVHVAACDVTLSAPLVVPQGTTLMGGYNPETGARDPLATPTALTLKGAAYPTAVITLNQNCELDGFQLWDADLAASNGIVYANGGTGAKPIVRNCVLGEGRNGWAAQYCDIATSILLGDTVNLEGCSISHCTFAGQIGESKEPVSTDSSLLGVGLGGLRPIAPAACPHSDHAVCPNGLDGRPLDNLGALAPDDFGVEIVKSARGYRLRLR